MTIKQVFTIYDSKAETYAPPFMTDSIGITLRSFSDAVKNPELDFYKHPEDYTLFHIAEFDNKTAKYKNLLTPKSIGTAQEFQTQPQLEKTVLLKDDKDL